MPSQAISPPPEWGNDELSKFIALTHNNQFAAFVRRKTFYHRLVRIDRLFLRVASNIINPENPIAAILFYRAHAAYRGACATAMAGQATETFVLIRSCLEYAAYGLHITDHPDTGEIWLNRNNNESNKKTMRKEFRPENYRATIRNRDPALQKIFDNLYERSIDFGGHPNQFGVTGSLQIEAEKDRKQFHQIYLHSDGAALLHALKSTAQAGVCVMRIFQFTMTNKFLLLGVRDGIEDVQHGL